MNLREEFEKECKEYGYSTHRCRKGDYHNMNVHIAWEYYQAGFRLGAKDITLKVVEDMIITDLDIINKQVEVDE